MRFMREASIIQFAPLRADALIEAGLEAVIEGDVKKARSEFITSYKLAPTADALTYWGWMEHLLGRNARAMNLCHRAIDLDPDYGNPYNDIGSYLLSDGHAEAAIPWFERATRAKRYVPREYPHINLGKIFAAQKHYAKALLHFEQALAFAPGHPEVLDAILAIEAKLQ